MRFVAAMLAILFLLAAAPAFAQDVETRCGLSLGAVAGIGIPYQREVHNEFDYTINLEVNVKYYLFWGVAIAGGTGYQYSEGAPEQIWKDGAVMYLDTPGTSFWRAWPVFGTLRVEFWRYGIWNPYIGGGAGITYLDVYRKGYVQYQPVSNGEGQWALNYLGIVGFDITLGKYFALRTEGKYRTMATYEDFLRGYDFGTYDIFAGINVYF